MAISWTGRETGIVDATARPPPVPNGRKRISGAVRTTTTCAWGHGLLTIERAFGRMVPKGGKELA